MDRKAKWMKTGYIKHEVYDRLSVSEARLMCFNDSSQQNFLYLQFGSIYLFLAKWSWPVIDFLSWPRWVIAKHLI